MEEADKIFIVYNFSYCGKVGVAFIKGYWYTDNKYYCTVMRFHHSRSSCNSLAEAIGDTVKKYGNKVTFTDSHEFMRVYKNNF